MQNHSSDMPWPRDFWLFYSLVLQETQNQWLILWLFYWLAAKLWNAKPVPCCRNKHNQGSCTQAHIHWQEDSYMREEFFNCWGGEKKKGKRKNKQKLFWLFKHCSYWRSVCKSELEASDRSCPQWSKQQLTAWSRTLGHWVTAQKADLDPPLSSRGNAEVIWNHRSNSYFLIYHIIC